MKKELEDALMDLYAKSTPEQGQHDLRRCRFCHAEEIWHGNPRFVAYADNLTHKPDCPVEKVRWALLDLD